ncbi:MAG: hypothetical protein Kow0042_09530 [Calditrichia bacterium]
MHKSFKWISALVLILVVFLFAQEPSVEGEVQTKFGVGFKFGVGSILGDKLSRTEQAPGPVTSLEGHFNLQETVEVITEVAYGYNDVDFTLGSATVSRIYQRSFTVGFRFYLNALQVSGIVPTLSFGSGFYEWFYTNSDEELNFSGDGIQKYKGRELSFHSVGLNAGLGLRYKISGNFALDFIARFHFIQSKDNTDRFGPNDDHDRNMDAGVGLVWLIPLRR